MIDYIICYVHVTCTLFCLSLYVQLAHRFEINICLFGQIHPNNVNDLRLKCLNHGIWTTGFAQTINWDFFKHFMHFITTTHFYISQLKNPNSNGRKQKKLFYCCNLTIDIKTGTQSTAPNGLVANLTQLANFPESMCKLSGDVDLIPLLMNFL